MGLTTDTHGGSVAKLRVKLEGHKNFATPGGLDIYGKVKLRA